MRILTNSEQRQIETLKRELTDMPTDGLDIHIAEREVWLNFIAIILEANEAANVAWKRSVNGRTDLTDLVKMALS